MSTPKSQTTRRQWSAVALLLLAWFAPTSGGDRIARAQTPYAAEVVSYIDAFGTNALYNDPASVLGEPTRMGVNGDPQIGTDSYRVKIVEPVYNRDAAGNKTLTTLSRKSNGAGGFIYGSITVKFDQPVLDNPTNPYGIDLNVFGNSFYAGRGFVNETTNMSDYELTGIHFKEPVVISVSPDNENWYTYGNGPYGDAGFPTQGYQWGNDAWSDSPTDFTKPVNPTLTTALGVANQIAADAMAAYVGSGGGTGIDLAPSGFEWIQYVRVDAAPGFSDGEIDAFADVRPMRVGEALSVTPTNVTADTRLYFQNPHDETHTSIAADFNSAGGLLKLSTSTEIDEAAMSALNGSIFLATYQLDVTPLIGGGPVDFLANFELAPGGSYTGEGDDLVVVSWNGANWLPLEFTFDEITMRATIADWTSPSATFAIVSESGVDHSGDFNSDGFVDAADYVIWRKLQGSSSGYDYETWRQQFGETLSAAGISQSPTSVPEPHPVIMAAIAAMFVVTRRRYLHH